MPPHTTIDSQLADFWLWQGLWQYLVTQGFAILPSNSTSLPDGVGSYFQITNVGGNVEHKTSTFTDSLQLTLLLKQQTLKIFRQFEVAEWSYLGNSTEKQTYLDYLNEHFWRHQNREELLSRSDYGILVAETFRIGKVATELDWPLISPIEMMSDKSQQFLAKLEGWMQHWQLNPYLINSEQGTFHWRLTAEKKVKDLAKPAKPSRQRKTLTVKYTLEGWIFKTTQGFVQQIKIFKV